MASEALARRVAPWLVVCCLSAAACRATPDIVVTWQVDPTPAVSGTVTVVRLKLEDRQREPLRGAKLRLEAHMSHPGMTPLTSMATETSPGTYEARIELSMAGDWILVLTGELADGGRVTERLNVVGVQGPRS